jgi:hypothetical protein
MATKKNKTLYNMEVPPPPEVWPHIAARLLEAYHAEDVPVAQKMYDMEFAPPAGAWENIAATLPQQQPAKAPVKVIAFARMMTAAAAMVLITLAAWYFLNNSSQKNHTAVATTKQSAANPGAATAAQPGEVAAGNTKSSLHRAAGTATGEGNPIASRYTNRGRYTYDDQPEGPSGETRSSYSVLHKAGITARRLRNANGQLVTNYDDASNDNCYMDITSPNGEQTRTSYKFMQILNALNSDDDAPGDYFDFMLQDNSVWKARIREWKNKLLNQTSFIPTGGFSDILELRDMLQQQDNQTPDNQ